MSIYKVYKITNRLNGKIYVGQTKQPLEKRLIQHLSTNSPLGQAMRQCGAENFTIEVIEECETQAQVNEREIFWIKVLNCKVPNGYNVRKGGNGERKASVASSKKMPASIGKNIHNLRINHNMTQKDLGNIAGVSEKTVSAWETERITPRMGAIQKMADYFGIKKSDIIEPMQITASFNTQRVIPKLSEDEVKLLDDYRELNATGQGVLLGVLNSLRVTHSAVV